MQTAGPQMRRSSVVGKNGGGAIDDVRTSYGMFVPRMRDPTFAAIEQRIAAWSNTTVVQQEDMQAPPPSTDSADATASTGSTDTIDIESSGVGNRYPRPLLPSRGASCDACMRSPWSLIKLKLVFVDTCVYDP